jgi:hypothetical protein
MTRIIVEIEGGEVRCVTADGPIEIVILNRDSNENFDSHRYAAPDVVPSEMYDKYIRIAEEVHDSQLLGYYDSGDHY